MLEPHVHPGPDVAQLRVRLPPRADFTRHARRTMRASRVRSGGEAPEGHAISGLPVHAFYLTLSLTPLFSRGIGWCGLQVSGRCCVLVAVDGTTWINGTGALRTG